MGSGAKANTAFLYIMATDGGPTKIGHSLDTARRVKDIQRQTDRFVIVTGKWPVGARIALAAERYVHYQLRDRHFRGEWFHVTQAEATAAIEQALKHDYDPYNLIPPIDPGGPLLRYGESFATKYPAGTLDRITAVLDGDEGRAAFIREAVEREIKRRERERRREGS